jgi:hypothetical protein
MKDYYYYYYTGELASVVPVVNEILEDDMKNAVEHILLV